MAGPWEQFQKPESESKPWEQFQQPEPQRDGNPLLDGVAGFAAGLGKGFGSTMLGAQRYVGKGLKALGDLDPTQQGERNLSQLISPSTKRNLLQSAGNWLEEDANTGRQRLQQELSLYQERSPLATGAGSIGGEIVATLPVGGVLAKGAGAIGASPALTAALRTSGFRTGAPAAATFGGKALDLGTRMLGGAATGGSSAALVDPESGMAGAVIGGALPGVFKGVQAGAKYAGGVARSVVDPFTQKGQQRIAGRILNKFAEDGPTSVDARSIVDGSLPTLSESTGNAGLAGLQRVVRDINPNQFVAREDANAVARLTAFDRIAGDSGSLSEAIAARNDAAKPLYNAAFTADAMRRSLSRDAQQMRAPFSGVGLSAAADDLATPGLRDLARRPMFRQAANDARALAANNGVELQDPLQSLEGLHYIKLALDDALNPAAKSAMGRNASNAIMDMRGKLENELADISPLYGNARQTFAEMSKPINAMEALQGLRLTNAQGNITLNKVSTAIDQIERNRAAPGVHEAKSITGDQLDTLYAIRDDLLRQSKTGLGRSAGSNTLQNIATDNILGNALPGKLGGKAISKVGDVLGQVGKIAYSGPNEKIRNGLRDMMLDPRQAEAAMRLQSQLPGRMPGAAIANALAPFAYRGGPVAGAGFVTPQPNSGTMLYGIPQRDQLNQDERERQLRSLLGQ